MPREERHRVRDISVRSLRSGSGEPLLFLHGASGLPVWGPFFEALSQRYEVLVLEHPGFGASDNPKWLRDVNDMAMYYLDVLDGLALPKLHLVGNSLGGWIAAELATRNCTQLASLTLLAPAGLRVKGIPSGDNFIWSPEDSVRNLFHDQALADHILATEVSEEERDLQLNSRFMAARLGWQPRWFNPALERWLHRIQVPTLLLWGEEDKLLPAAYAAAWEAQIPDIRVERLRECGHLPHIEKPAVTADRVLAFLEGK
ncbi:alpha/beta fold hydrolase [Roseomonas sp. BN140053]|uniref:alpha/beta fold hydrolase n=1 Tax=Roseomonas sp. BN140053 TaxID=3391898 RepID=UPI0039ED1B8C